MYECIEKLNCWLDQYLNFEKTPKKNIFWLDTMNFFCEKFGHPELKFPTIHVAGSKGKGSISKMIACILNEYGKKTGLYTSPHILNFIERVSGCDYYFDESVYENSVNKLIEKVNKINIHQLPLERPVTWFELVTLFSFLCFENANVDFGIFEVGLGGRLDSTNVIKPKVCCIGPIELEHTEFLGDTLEKIAFEKGGIIKDKTPVIIAPQSPEVKKVFQSIAKDKNAPLIFIDEAVKISDDVYNFIQLKYKKSDILINKLVHQAVLSSEYFSRPLNVSLQLCGKFQLENAALAAVTVKQIFPQIPEEIIEKGLNKAFLPGRFETLPNPYNNKQVIILDGAHTVKSINFTLDTLEQHKRLSDNFNAHLLFGCAADKDSENISKLFRDKFSYVTLTKPGNVKQSNLQKIESDFSNCGINYYSSEDYITACTQAIKKAASENATLLVTGSFYLVSEVTKILGTL